MKWRDCVVCHMPFPQDKPWEMACTPCWKESRGFEQTKADQTQRAYQQEIRRMVGELAAFQAAPLPPPPAPPPEPVPAINVAWASEGPVRLTAGQVKHLLVLCHPDKHQNDPRAAIVTKWLLALRQKLRGERDA